MENKMNKRRKTTEQITTKAFLVWLKKVLQEDRKILDRLSKH